MGVTDDLLDGLNPPQRQAVLHRDGPLLVVAGPGSGKTRVITRRAAMLVRTGIPPRNILAITFTNKAADEMKRRIAALDVGPGMWVHTFHALGVRLLREFGERAEIKPGFTIYDDDDQIKVVKEAMAACGIADTLIKPETALHRISGHKNALRLPAACVEAANTHDERFVARIYEKYERMMRERNAVDFDDLLLRVALVLRDDAATTERLNIRFRYLLIDEYQDTNYAQYVIARQLSTHHRNICATGDPDQSIYAWRGADIRNILEFEQDFPDATIIRLEQNYRSTGNVLAIASSVIAHNKRRKAKELWTESDAGDPAELWEFDEGSSEAQRVAETIAAMRAEGCDWSDFAIFYRVNAVSRGLEEALRHRGIPYRIARGVEFYNRREIRDTLAYLRVVVNPADRVSLLRIINTPPRGIGDTTVKRVTAVADERGLALMDVIRRAADFAELRAAAPKLKRFTDLLDKLAFLTSGTVPDAVTQVLTLSGLEAALRKEGEVEGEDRIANVEELVSAAARYDAETPEPSLADFLTRVALVSDQDAVDEAAGVVMLMTLHAAKGLEFPVVFLVGLEQGMLPHERAIREGDIEEERRLLFVGITRAQRRLYLTHADERFIRGQFIPRAASQFVQELPEVGVIHRRFRLPRRGVAPHHDDAGGDDCDDDATSFDVSDDDPGRTKRPRDSSQALSRGALPGGHRRGLRRGRWAGGAPSDEPTYSLDDPTRGAPRYVPEASPYAGWTAGTLVQHEHFGVGQVQSISFESAGRTRAVVRFPGQGDKTLILEFAPLRRLERS